MQKLDPLFIECLKGFMAGIAAIAGGLVCPGQARAAEPAEVMILGTVHMDNPGLDLHNIKIEDVLQPEYQAQIARITDSLTRFRPTAVFVESPPDWAGERYALYLADKLEPSRDETVQLGFRLARRLGLETVHGIDAFVELPYGPVEEFAKGHGQGSLLDSMHAEVETLARSEEELLRTQGISAELRHINDPGYLRDDHAIYRRIMRIGGGDDQPGAEYVAAWYRRNLLICARMVQLIKPGDRVVVIFGGGHAFLLRQCVSETPGLKLIEANSYLPE